MTVPSWEDERPTHGIMCIRGTVLQCTCGAHLVATDEEINRGQRAIYDALLDRHARHKYRQERKK